MGAFSEPNEVTKVKYTELPGGRGDSELFS